MATRVVPLLLGLAIAVAIAHGNEEEGEGSLRPGRSISYDESNDVGDDAVPAVHAADVPPPDASQLAPYFSQVSVSDQHTLGVVVDLRLTTRTAKRSLDRRTSPFLRPRT
jgi:hypothetical protein